MSRHGLKSSYIRLISVGFFLFGVKPFDPQTVASAVVILIGVSVIAALLPAHRASRIDPALALREE